MSRPAHWVTSSASGNVSVGGTFAMAPIVLPVGATLMRTLFYPRLSGLLAVIQAAISPARAPEFHTVLKVTSALYPNQIVFEEFGIVPHTWAMMQDSSAGGRFFAVSLNGSYRNMGADIPMSLGGPGTPAMTLSGSVTTASIGGGGAFTSAWAVDVKALYEL